MKLFRSAFLQSLTIVLSAILLLSCLNACQSEPPTADGTITFTDDLGRTVTLSKKPVRVAALLGSYADLWLLAGGEICAAAEDAWEDFNLPLENAANIGGAHSPNTERLIAAAPDLVLAGASSPSHTALEELLESAGVPVAYFDIDHFDDYLRVLKICTDLTERPDLYLQNGTRIAEQVEAVKTAFANAPLREQERRVLVLRVSASSIKAKGSTGTILGEMLRDLGCINIADNDQSILDNLSIERILQENPYRIFAVTMGSDTAAAELALHRLLSENGAWASLDAVKHGRVHMMEKNLFNLKPNARWGTAYERLYETLTN